MENAILVPTQWANAQPIPIKLSILDKWNALADKQAENKTLWFIVSLIAQGVLFLPIPAALIHYFNAPLPVLAITLGLYFANIIAGMGGAGIRVMLLLFASSVFLHLLMIGLFSF
jgi:hypothetical protein